MIFESAPRQLRLCLLHAHRDAKMGHILIRIIIFLSISKLPPSICGSFDPFMDQTMFAIDWKGPLLNPLVSRLLVLPVIVVLYNYYLLVLVGKVLALVSLDIHKL